MFSILTLLTLRQWRCHKLRVALTTLGIALGVAAFFSARTASSSVRSSLKTTVEKIAGKTNLQITAGESGFPEAILDVARNTPGVFIAEPAIETMVKTPLPNGGELLVIGIDSTSDKNLREYDFDERASDIPDPLAMVARPWSLVISRPFAERHHLKTGDKLPLYTPKGLKEFTVIGVFKPAGVGEVFGGQVAVMDVYAAQLVFDRGHNFDRIDILTGDDIDVEKVRARIRQELPSGLNVTRPELREQSLDNWVGAMQAGQEVMSYLALAVGVFLIFNSFSIAVNHRWKEIGVLRGLGVESHYIRRMFLAEAAVLGLIGSAIGIAFGFYVAALSGKIMASVAASAYGQISVPPTPVFLPYYAIASFGIGIGASLIAAWLPARAASRISPALALHNIETRQRESNVGWRRISVGIVLILAGLTFIRFNTVKVGLILEFAYCGLMLIGFVLLLPKCIELLARSMRPLLNVFGAEGLLAVDTMVRSPRRSSATVGAVMIGLAFVFANGAAIRAYYNSVLGSIDHTLNTDMMIVPTNQLRSRTYRFNEGFCHEIAAIDKVFSAECKRFTFLPFRGDSVGLVATDSVAWLDRAGDIFETGNSRSAREAMVNGTGAIVSENFAKRWRVNLGDKLSIDSPAGNIQLPVVGTIEDFHSEKGTIFIERAVYKAYWNDDSIDYVNIKLKPGTDPNEIRSAVQALASGRQEAFVYTNSQYKVWISGLIDQFFTVYYAQIVIAIIVAAIGIVNTLTISVSERTREIGVIRAIGGLRGQVRKIIFLEAMVIAFAGIVTGAISSIFVTYFLVHTATTMIAGFDLPFRIPFDLMLLSVPIALAVSAIAAWWPAQLAVKLPVIESLSYE